MLTLIAAAFGLGLIFNAAPGAVFAETVRRGIRGGFRPALAVQLGSLAGDTLWALLGLSGVGLLFQSKALQLPVGVAGAGYLLWLAWDAWRGADREFALDPSGGVTAKNTALRSGILLSITNPQNIAYWAALGSAMSAVGVHQPNTAAYGVFFAGFMVSSIVWSFLCAAIVTKIFQKAGARWTRLTYRLCAITFLILALSSLRSLRISPAVPAVTIHTSGIGYH